MGFSVGTADYFYELAGNLTIASAHTNTYSVMTKRTNITTVPIG